MTIGCDNLCVPKPSRLLKKKSELEASFLDVCDGGKSGTWCPCRKLKSERIDVVGRPRSAPQSHGRRERTFSWDRRVIGVRAIMDISEASSERGSKSEGGQELVRPPH